MPKYIKIKFQSKALNADKVVILVNESSLIPAKNEITALVPDKNLFATMI